MDVSSALPSQTPTLHEWNVGSQVDIQGAERAFHRLEREASRASDNALRISRNTFNEKDAIKESENYDAEKAEFKNGEEPFDLKEYLSSSNDKNTQAGIKHKHVGVTWEDLQVEVVGGGDYKVRRSASIWEDALFKPNLLDLHRNFRKCVSSRS